MSKQSRRIAVVVSILIGAVAVLSVVTDAESEPVQKAKPTKCQPIPSAKYRRVVRQINRARNRRYEYTGQTGRRWAQGKRRPTRCDLKRLRKRLHRERRVWRRTVITIPPLLQVIARCENNTGSYTRKNYAFPKPSTASGRYMMIDSTFWAWARGAGIKNPHRWRYALQAPPRVQDLAAVHGFAGGRGINHWDPSRGCWG